MGDIVDLESVRQEREEAKREQESWDSFSRGLNGLLKIKGLWVRISEIPSVAKHRKLRRDLYGWCSSERTFEMLQNAKREEYTDVKVGRVFGLEIKYRKDRTTGKISGPNIEVISLEEHGVKGVYGRNPKGKMDSIYPLITVIEKI